MKILIIDDEPNILENTGEYLEFSGYEVIVATDGLSGIEAAKTHLPNLIISDLMLPGLDGHAVLKTLQDDPDMKHIPVIITSGNVQKAVIDDVMAKGAVRFLAKPYNTAILLETIRQHIR